MVSLIAIPNDSQKSIQEVISPLQGFLIPRRLLVRGLNPRLLYFGPSGLTFYQHQQLNNWTTCYLTLPNYKI